MHIDSRRLKDLFYKNKQVKACISGHIHMVDRVHYLGVAYLCNGAVCGAWWKGDCQEFKPGYAILDLYPDGLVFSRYVSYGWTG
jgi:predicted phosphodiesterase